MRVPRVVMPETEFESWTVLGAISCRRSRGAVLAYLASIETSPTTIKAYAHDLREGPSIEESHQR